MPTTDPIITISTVADVFVMTGAALAWVQGQTVPTARAIRAKSASIANDRALKLNAGRCPR
jgi:hypothetical protein